jgi:hypothetical protein
VTPSVNDGHTVRTGSNTFVSTVVRAP